jgi:threonine aldolase
MTIIDLRSDTVTKPTPEMRRAMAEAEVGDDVLGDDPTVLRLQALAAEKMGKEAALFVPSGIMANLVSLLTLTGRNEEVICGGESHLYTAEVGGAGVLGNLFMHVLPNEPDGTIPLERLLSAIRNEVYTPRTKVVSLENTHNRCSGAVLSPDYIRAASEIASAGGAFLHLDGARIFNAAVALGIPTAEIVRPAEVVNFCLSKGLSAPVGSLVCGTRAFIEEARRTRRMLGGGMRQAGVLAAAGIVALNTMIDRLVEDHENARLLAHELAHLAGVKMDATRVQTNIVIFELAGMDTSLLVAQLREHGLWLSRSGHRLRAVTHAGITKADIKSGIKIIARAIKELG